MGESPIEKFDATDPGDDTQLRIRYQHSYGLILFCNELKKNEPCKSLWFEQHEDILVEKKNSHFNFYQVKTREKTLGKWRVTDRAFERSIKRFCQFEKNYKDCVDNYFFVSNCPYRESRADTKEDEQAISPLNFFHQVKRINAFTELQGSFKSIFDKLLGLVDVEAEILFSVLKKIKLVVGPPLENFELELSGTHLQSLPQLKDKSLTYINRIRDEFVQQISNASSLKVDDSYKHVFCHVKDEKYDPRVMSKKN